MLTSVPTKSKDTQHSFSSIQKTKIINNSLEGKTLILKTLYKLFDICLSTSNNKILENQKNKEFIWMEKKEVNLKIF